MILVNDNWEQIYDLQDVSKIIREYYNRDLADELDKLIPEHTDEEYEELEYEVREKSDKIESLEAEISNLENNIERLEEDLDGAEKIIDELEAKISELKSR